MKKLPRVLVAFLSGILLEAAISGLESLNASGIPDDTDQTSIITVLVFAVHIPAYYLADLLDLSELGDYAFAFLFMSLLYGLAVLALIALARYARRRFPTPARRILNTSGQAFAVFVLVTLISFFARTDGHGLGHVYAGSKRMGFPKLFWEEGGYIWTSEFSLGALVVDVALAFITAWLIGACIARLWRAPLSSISRTPGA